MQGFLITLEGVEGSGKTTQIDYINRYLVEAGYEVEITKEPGGTPIGNKIRELLLDPVYKNMDPRTEILLYAADRAQDVIENIAPALEQGKIVLADRYLDSNIAYQGYGRGLDLEIVESINKWVVQEYIPDLTIILDLPVEKGLERARNLSNDRLDQEIIEFHERVRTAYQKMAARERFVLIDADSTPKQLSRKIYAVIKEKLLE